MRWYQLYRAGDAPEASWAPAPSPLSPPRMKDFLSPRHATVPSEEPTPRSVVGEERFHSCLSARPRVRGSRDQGKGVPRGESKDQRWGVRHKHVGVWGTLPSLAGPGPSKACLRPSLAHSQRALEGETVRASSTTSQLIFLFLSLLRPAPPPAFSDTPENKGGFPHPTTSPDSATVGSVPWPQRRVYLTVPDPQLRREVSRLGPSSGQPWKCPDT